MQDFLHLHWILGLTHIAGKPPPNPNRFEPIIRPCKLDDEISMLSPRYSALFHAHLILLVFSSKIVWTALCPTPLTRASKGTYPSLLFHKSSQEARSRPCFLPQCVNMTKKVHVAIRRWNLRSDPIQTSFGRRRVRQMPTCRSLAYAYSSTRTKHSFRRTAPLQCRGR